MSEGTIEEQAREMGWLPKEEYEAGERDPAKWVPAEIFVARAPLFEKIDQETKANRYLRKEVDNLKTVVHELKGHTDLARREGYKRAMEELKLAKRTALAEEDLIRADEIQDRIDDLKEEVKATPQPTPQQPPAEFVEWSAQNQWYKLEPEMRKYADAVGIVAHNDGMSPSEVLRHVTEEVRKKYPEKFRNPMKDKAPAVETQPTSGGAPKKSKFTPTPEQEAIAKRFAATGVMTVEQYYKDLQAMEE